ncbi:MAG: hypothetical protein U5K00_03480 [Melioribacteraceae bacterium]|nr:hypothetical protein [Melioribacteraceae bacterium]
MKALISVGYSFPIKSVLISSGAIESKAELLETARILTGLGIEFYATPGTAKFMKSNNIPVVKVDWHSGKKHPNAIDLSKIEKVDLVINIPKNFQEEELTNDYTTRRAAVDYKIPLITNRQLAMRLQPKHLKIIMMSFYKSKAGMNIPLNMDCSKKYITQIRVKIIIFIPRHKIHEVLMS